MIIELNANNKNHTASADYGTTLYNAFRDLGYKSVKRGRTILNCGLCTVWLDDVPVFSRSILVLRCEGKKITTLEGMSESQRKFGGLLIEEGGEQRGFCSSGFITNALSSKKIIKNPIDEEIEDHLMGNLYRYTGYAPQMRAIKKYSEIDDEDK